MQKNVFGFDLRQTTTLCKINHNLLLFLCFSSIVFFFLYCIPFVSKTPFYCFLSLYYLFFLLNFPFAGLHMVFPNDGTVAMLMSQSEERAAMLVPETNPQGSKLYDCANNFFRFFLRRMATVSKV